MSKLVWILKRLREPSTHAALVAGVALFGGPIGLPDVVAQVAGAVSGVLAICLPEKAEGKAD